MDLGIRTLDVIFSMLGFLFAFWPILVVAPVARAGDTLTKMFFVWAVLLLLRIALIFSRLGTFDFLIHEPLNTAAFALAGLGLIAALAIRRARNRA